MNKEFYYEKYLAELKICKHVAKKEGKNFTIDEFINKTKDILIDELKKDLLKEIKQETINLYKKLHKDNYECQMEEDAYDIKLTELQKYASRLNEVISMSMYIIDKIKKEYKDN